MKLRMMGRPFAVTALLLVLATSLQAADGKFFDSDGTKIHYIEAGEGEPVVLVHGFSANHVLNWVAPGIFKALSDNYHVIAIDNRGHGKSDKPHDPEQYGEEMVQDIVRLLDHLEIDKAHIVGYSMGGFITNKLLSQHPERFLTATLGGAGWSKEGDGASELMEPLAQSLEEGNGITPLIIALTPPGRPQPTDNELNLINQMVMATNDPKALAAAIRGMQNLRVPQEKLEANEVPTLALIGEVDPLKVGVDALQEVMPNLQVVVIDKADHMTAIGNPKFIDSLKGFLVNHSRQPAAAGAAGN